MRTFRGWHDDAPSRAGVRAVLLLAIGVVLFVAPQVAAASTTLDIRGTYVGTSNANSQNYSIGAVITTEDCATGAFSGYGYSNGQVYSTITGTVTGDISNNSETSYEVYTNVNYSATGAGTYSLDGQGRLVLTGTFSDTNGASGTAQSVRVDGPTDGLCGGSYTTSTTSTSSSSSSSSSTVRPSAMQVSCDYYFATTAYVCTAQVGDASGQQPPGIPGGTVTFSPQPGATGVFAQQKQCTLMPSQTGGASSYCSVTYSSPAPLRLDTQPPITAHYSGDVNFQPTDASPQNIYATTTSISTDTTSATSTSQPTTTSTSGTTTSSGVTTSASSSTTSSSSTCSTSCVGCPIPQTPVDDVDTPAPPAVLAAPEQARAANLAPPSFPDPYCPNRTRYSQNEKNKADQWAVFYGLKSAELGKASVAVGAVALSGAAVPEPFVSKVMTIGFGAESLYAGWFSYDFAQAATQETIVHNDPPDAAWRTIAAPLRMHADRIARIPGLNRRQQRAWHAYGAAALALAANEWCIGTAINRGTTALSHRDVSIAHRQYRAGAGCARHAAGLDLSLPQLAKILRAPLRHLTSGRLSSGFLKRVIRAEGRASFRRRVADREIAALRRVIALPAADIAKLRSAWVARLTITRRSLSAFSRGMFPSDRLDRDAARLQEQSAQVLAAAAKVPAPKSP